jgi:hypothetical protein
MPLAHATVAKMLSRVEACASACGGSADCSLFSSHGAHYPTRFACCHAALLTLEALLRLGLSPAAKVLDLKDRLRCRGCGRKGRAVVSIKWRGQGA